MTDEAKAVSSAEVSADDEGKTTPRRRRRRGRFACLFGVLFGFAGLVSGRLGVLWIHFDVFSQFTLQFAAILVAFIVGYFMPRARVLTALVLIGIALTAIGLWPHLASQAPHPLAMLTEGERPIKVMSFNSLIVNPEVDAVAEEVLRNDPDIAALVEIGDTKPAVLARLKERYPYQEACLAIPHCHMAVVAKYPILNAETRMEWKGPPILKVSFGPELSGLTVIGVHTLRFPHQRAQLHQIGALAEFVGTLDGPRLVMGDFNATPFSRLLTSFAGHTHFERLTFLPTWPAQLQLPQLAIDHVFASPGIRALDEPRIGENAGSDHYPVIVNLAVPKP